MEVKKQVRDNIMGAFEALCWARQQAGITPAAKRTIDSLIDVIVEGVGKDFDHRLKATV